MASHFLVGLDIGTSSVKVVVAQNRQGKPTPRLIFKIPSRGLAKGAVADIAEVSQVVNEVFHEVKKLGKPVLKNVFVSLGTHQMKCQNSQGIVAVSRTDAEIYQDDIDRALRASQAVTFAPNWVIVHHIAREFIVDNIADLTTPPLGLSGSRLEVKSLLIAVFSKHVKDIMRVVEVNGALVGGVVITPLAAMRAVLSKNQKKLGTVVIDFGAETTGLGVYEGSKLLGTAVVPKGQNLVTNDIAVCLRIPVDAAEIVKRTYGFAVPREVSVKEIVDLAKCDPKLEGTVKRHFISEVIEARLAEILNEVHNELKGIVKTANLPGGAVLVGGGSKLPGLSQLVRERLKLSSQVGLALKEEWAPDAQSYSEYFEDPEFVNALGLVLVGVDKEGWQAPRSAPVSWKNPFGFLRYFLP